MITKGREYMALFYLLIFLVFVVYGFTQQSKNPKKSYLIVVFAVIGAMMMFKAPSVGNDSQMYIGLYKRLLTTTNMERFFATSRYEKGYVYLNYLLGKISPEPQTLFIVCGAFIAFTFARFIYKYSELPWLSVLMFLTLQFFDLSLSGTRQILSVAILIYAYDFLLQRKFWRFLLLVLLANCFHSSAILFLLLYPLTGRKKETTFYLGSVLVALAVYVGFDVVIGIVGKIFPQYLHYLTGDGGSYSTTATLASVLMLGSWLVLFIVAKCYQKPTEPDAVLSQEEEAVLYTNAVHEVAVWMGIIMLFLALNGTILNRFKYIFSFPMLVYFPNMMCDVQDKKVQKALLISSSIVLILYIWIIYTFRPEWQSSFPYHFFWQER